MLHVAARVVPIVVLAACDLTDPERAIVRGGPAAGNASFAAAPTGLSTTGVPITDLGALGGPASQALAINDSGQVVGMGWTDGEIAGFLLADGVKTNLGGIQPAAINNGGQIAASCGYARHACLWENDAVTDLGTLGGGASEAADINDAGQVVGSSQTASGQWHGFLWAGRVVTDVGAIRAASINEHGQIAGTCETHACLWANGAITDLGTLGGPSSYAADINNAGQVVGTSLTAAGQTHAFLWTNGVMRDLGDLGRGQSEARAINDAGQVVGYACWDRCDNEYAHETVLHAFLWANGEMTDLGTLGGSSSVANDINAAGQIVGHAFRTGDSTISEPEQSGRAVLWQPEAGNTAPRVSAGPDHEVELGQEVSVTIAFPDATPTGPWSWSVAWGDQDLQDQTLTSAGIASTDDPIAVSHTYLEGGRYTVRVRVTDGAGGVGVDEAVVTVAQPANNTAPIVTAGPDRQAWPGARVSFSFTIADSTHNGPWAWRLEFGDGTATSATTRTPGEIVWSYVYGATGQYTARLTVSDGSGATGAGELTVTILQPPEGNLAPAVTASQDGAALTGEPADVTFTFDDQATPNGPWTWVIAWGDGATTGGTATSTFAVTWRAHAYAAAAQYVARVTVTDAAGATGSDDVIFTVRANTPPAVSAGPDLQGPVSPPPIKVSATASDSTPTNSLNWRVSFGDGTTGAGFTPGTGGSIAWWHAYEKAGLYTAVVTATDQIGASGSDTVLVAVGSPRERVQALIDEVNRLVPSGPLRRAASKGLPAKLRQVLALLDGGRAQAAKSTLESFVSQVQGFIKVKLLATERAAPLIAAARSVIGELEGLGAVATSRVTS